MKALADVDGGLKTEYESHVVTVYSMLCGELIKNDGHHAVLKAHEEARSLIDSLKVLSQNIKGYYDKLNAEAIREKAASVLHEHYDLYMGEVLDKAYKRLKTSEITIPNSVRYIVNAAFFNNELINVTIPEKIEFIGNGVFSINPLNQTLRRKLETRYGRDAVGNNNRM